MRIGLLLPWRRLVVDTAWSPVEAKEEIPAILDGPDASRHVAWRGSQGIDGFRMWQGARRSTRDAALVVSGAVRPTEAGSRVAMTVRLPVPVLLFMGAWLGGVLVGGVASIAVAVAQRRIEALIFWLVPAGQWVVASLMMRTKFVREARELERFLRGLFPPCPPPNMGPFR
jgi:hypothetical protein